MLSIAIIGCGRIGTLHAHTLQQHPLAQLVALYDTHNQNAQQLASLHNLIPSPSDNHIFASPSVDAVIIASSAHTHADYIEKAIAHNKPVFCEKPIDLSLQRVLKCARNLPSTHIPIQIGFNRRFDPSHHLIKQRLNNGDIGTLHQVIISSRDPAIPPPEYFSQSGGIFRDMTIHDFDIARFMIGEEPTTISAIASRQVNPPLMQTVDDFDSIMILMQTDTGTQCHINNHRQAPYGYDQRIELMGSHGMLLSDNHTPQNTRHFSSLHTSSAPPLKPFFVERYSEAFSLQISHFIECILQKKTPSVTFNDGLKALILAEAALLSLKEKRTVHISEISQNILDNPSPS